jgi:L-fuculose-phosphate aldolase
MRESPARRFADFDEAIAYRLLEYAARLSRRGYVSNTLGNIAIRAAHPRDAVHGVVYTKHRGVSLEEMTVANVIVTDVASGELLHGAVEPSIGHLLSRTLLALRPDAGAVIHLHVDELIAYFSVCPGRHMRFISADAALVLSRPVWILEPNVNVETDASLLAGFADQTNCIVMPNHGVITVGRDVSEAFHRLNTITAEVRRIVLALQVAAATGAPMNWVPEAEVAAMFRDSARVVYGED